MTIGTPAALGRKRLVRAPVCAKINGDDDLGERCAPPAIIGLESRCLAVPAPTSPPFMPVVIFNREFETLRDTDTVADATRRMLENRMSDLPVVDGAGKLVGTVSARDLLAVLQSREKR
jgi:hypothetical protein